MPNPPEAWQTIEWRQGTKGTMQAQVLALRVHWATGSPRHSTSHSRVHTGPEGWLLAERPVPAPKRQEPATDEPRPPDDTAKQEAAEEKEAEETKYWFSSLAPRHLVGATGHPGPRALGDRAVLRRCQTGMWSG